MTTKKLLHEREQEKTCFTGSLEKPSNCSENYKNSLLRISFTIAVVHCGLRIPALATSLLCLLLLRWLIRVISAPPDNTACLENCALYLASDPPIEMNKQCETNRNRKREREHHFLSSKHLWEVNLLKRQRLHCRHYTQHFYQDCSIRK